MRQEQEKQRKEQEMRRRLNEAKQAEEARRQEDYKKQQLIKKDKILVQQQQMLVTSPPSKILPSSSISSNIDPFRSVATVRQISSEQTSTTKTSGGDVKQKVLAMQQLIKEQGSEVRAPPTSKNINPLSPDIHLQILHTDLYTFPLRISWENLKKDQGIFTLVIILLILITFSFDNVWIFLGENWFWSPLGLKGLKN